MLKKVFIFSFLLSAVLLSESSVFSYLSRGGKISVSIENAGQLDIKNGLPKKEFEVRTFEGAYLALQDGDSMLLIGENSRVFFDTGMFTVKSGSLAVKSSDVESRAGLKLAVDGKYIYSLEGSAFSVINERSNSLIYSIGDETIITKEGDIAIDYLLMKNERSSLSRGLSMPDVAEEEEMTRLQPSLNILENELKKKNALKIKRYTRKLFEGTKYETEYYRVEHEKPGPNVFILAPHADEKGAPIVARRAYQLDIKCGSITSVAKAVAPAYSKSARYHIEDLNRQFYLDKKDDKVNTDIDMLADRYKELIEEYDIDLIIALHESRVLYIDDNDRYGMSIVYDGREYEGTVDEVISRINKRIEVDRYKMQANYKPMPTTLTHYGRGKGIDSYSIEMYMPLSIEIKVKVQSAVLKEFLKIYGMY